MEAASFEPNVVSIRAVRGFVRDCLATGPDVEIDLVVLLVSELATNAVVHGRSDFKVSVDFLASSVRVTVEDHSAVLPILRHSSKTDIGGRGLEMIDIMAAQWGCEATFLGKRVWFDVAFNSK